MKSRETSDSVFVDDVKAYKYRGRQDGYNV